MKPAGIVGIILIIVGLVGFAWGGLGWTTQKKDAQLRNRRAIRWLRSQLPELVASGVISSENARAIDGYYEHDQPRVNFAFVILAALGSALVAAGIILLIAHNWDDLSRATRTGVAFLPLLIAQALVVFTLMRRNESRPWREATAIFDVAAVATAISLISQTYQVQGTFSDFMRTWLLLSIVIVYLLRTSLGAIAYVIGCALWLFARWGTASSAGNPMLFWFLLTLVIPYVAIRFRSDCDSRETTTLVITVALAAMFGVGATAEFADAMAPLQNSQTPMSAQSRMRDWRQRFISAESNFSRSRLDVCICSHCSVELRSVSLRLCSALNQTGT